MRYGVALAEAEEVEKVVIAGGNVMAASGSPVCGMKVEYGE